MHTRLSLSTECKYQVGGDLRGGGKMNHWHTCPLTTVLSAEDIVAEW